MKRSIALTLAVGAWLGMTGFLFWGKGCPHPTGNYNHEAWMSSGPTDFIYSTFGIFSLFAATLPSGDGVLCCSEASRECVRLAYECPDDWQPVSSCEQCQDYDKRVSGVITVDRYSDGADLVIEIDSADEGLAWYDERGLTAVGLAQRDGLAQLQLLVPGRATDSGISSSLALQLEGAVWRNAPVQEQLVEVRFDGPFPGQGEVLSGSFSGRITNPATGELHDVSGYFQLPLGESRSDEAF